jgi:hypothetical protein
MPNKQTFLKAALWIVTAVIFSAATDMLTEPKQLHFLQKAFCFYAVYSVAYLCRLR